MKKSLSVALMILAGSAYAGHPRCVGSYEPAKCEALEAKLASETPEQKKSAANKLEAERAASMAIARSFSNPTTPVVKQACNPGSPYVGMSEKSLENICKIKWTRTTDYGTVVYRWYQVSIYHVMVKNGFVAAVSY